MNDDINRFKLNEYVAHSTQVNCLTFGPLSAQVLATGGEDFKVNIWRVDSAANIWCLKQNKSPVECLCFDAEEQYICSGAMNGSLKVFDLNEGKLARNLRGHQVNITSIHYHPYGEFIVSGSYDNTMKVWDVRNKTCVQTYSGHDREITCTRFSPDGRWVASSAKDGQLMLWDLIAGKLVNTIKVPNAHLTAFEFNPEEFLLAGATSSRSVKFWDLQSMEEIGHTTPDSTQVRSITFSDAGTRLCTANNDTLRIWSWDPVTLQHSQSIGWEKVSDMRVAPESDTLVAGTFTSNFVSLWSVDLAEMCEEQSASVEEAEDKSYAQGNDTQKDAPRQPQSQSARSKPDHMPLHDIEDDNDDDEPYVPPVRQAYESSPEKHEIISAGAPEVHWEGGKSAVDMATSMGESFLQRLKDEEAYGKVSEEWSVHDRLPPSSVSRYPQGRRPQTRDREQAVASRRQDRRVGRGAGAAPVVPLDNRDSGKDGYGLAVVGLRPSTGVSPSHKDNLKADNIKADIKQDAKLEARNPPQHKYLSNTPSPTCENEYESRPRAGDAKRSVADASSGPSADNSHRRVASDRYQARHQSLPAEPPHHRAASDNYVPMREKSPVARGLSDDLARASNVISDLPQQVTDRDIDRMHDTVEKLTSQSDLAVSVLSQRLTNIRLLRQYWERGDMTFIIEHMKTIQSTGSHDTSQLVVLSDFLTMVDLKNSVVTLDVCGQLLPVLDTALDSGNGALVSAALRGVVSLCESFGELVRQTRMAAATGGGVDISREERLRKCNVSHATFSKIRNKLDSLRHHHRRNIALRGIVDRVQPLLADMM
mmetsp:Transcript_13082/g.19727  ORF Transcript_13082/g.19727 Transcript_13082/m.19727 type:complete len:819 (-) Transcript_13082:122-2578(-)|eukprot:CAMPEP_0185032776 /NCGR_PEP_ID=MMETSP1103-20130426/21162_1 /TAXON_ID=36769 /ORGANISM="Paraphysomonas bandaiensis, Strain Caron Lab Isolate" /LENGTH=818 /DNA_ID=CAMNT_0027568795 /DNA_START=105 /DNA_END=2564 /DNA_ORIENTATION=-